MHKFLSELSNFIVEIANREKDNMYGFRLLVFSRKNGKKIVDRTFVAHNEQLLMLKFQSYIAKKRLLREFTPKKVRLRIMDTTTHLTPIWFFTKLQQETDGKVFLHEGETENHINLD